MKVVSPLTKKSDVKLLGTIDSNDLIEQWKKQYQFDISPELQGHSSIDLYQCNESKLKFFVPIDTTGSSRLYERLQKIEWYYMPFKWEHAKALNSLSDCQNILEVGCGKGSFVEYLCTNTSKDVRGIELNREAVNHAINKGIPVSMLSLQELIDEEVQFDAVCSFQVLEHVSDPKEFIHDLLKLVRPGGKLLLSVPNSESFARFEQSPLLDQPPHHMTRWCFETFEYLTQLFPLEIEIYEYEPLAIYHINWYLLIQINRIIWLNKTIKNIIFLIARMFLKPLMEINFIRNHIVGHTLYVCYEKTAR